MYKLKKRIKSPKLWKWIIVSCLVIIVLLSAASVYFVNFALTAPDKTDAAKHDVRFAYAMSDFPELMPRIDSLMDCGALRDTFFVNDKGLREHALFMRNEHSNGRTAVLIHGYTVRCEWMLPISTIYMDLNYNLLLPDLHGHGQSEGDDIQMGWKDREDVMRWISRADGIFGKDLKIVVHGVSMGAATTMCVAGENTSDEVKCFVEDCGYTSVFDEFRNQMKAQFSLPAFPLLYTSSVVCQLMHGWSFQEASPLQQVKKCNKPMLFIHGDSDDYVLTEMVYPLYEAKPGIKELLITKSTAHAASYKNHPQEYQQRVTTFVNKYCQ